MVFPQAPDLPEGQKTCMKTCKINKEFLEWAVNTKQKLKQNCK